MRDSGWVFAKALSRSVSDEARLPGKCQNKKALIKIMLQLTMRKSPIMYHEVKKLQGPGNEVMASVTSRGVGAAGGELNAGVS